MLEDLRLVEQVQMAELVEFRPTEEAAEQLLRQERQTEDLRQDHHLQLDRQDLVASIGRVADLAVLSDLHLDHLDRVQALEEDKKLQVSRYIKVDTLLSTFFLPSTKNLPYYSNCIFDL